MKQPPSLATLADLNALCRQVTVVLHTPAGLRSMPARLLTPAEEQRLRELVLEARPPLKIVERPDAKGAMQKVEELDWSDPEYGRRAALVNRQARALALVLAVPAFTEAWAAHAPGAGVADVARLSDWLEQQATVAILDTIYSQVVSNTEESAKALEGFFSAAGSRPN